MHMEYYIYFITEPLVGLYLNKRVQYQIFIPEYSIKAFYLDVHWMRGCQHFNQSLFSIILTLFLKIISISECNLLIGYTPL